METIKVGSKVVLKSDLKVNDIVNGLVFRDFLVFKGEAKVVEADGCFYKVENNPYWYSTDMFEVVEERPVRAVKVGDKVRLRKDIQVGDVVQCFTLYKKMIFEGEKEIISISPYGDGAFRVEEKGYWYPEGMLELVEECHQCTFTKIYNGFRCKTSEGERDMWLEHCKDYDRLHFVDKYGYNSKNEHVVETGIERKREVRVVVVMDEYGNSNIFGEGADIADIESMYDGRNVTIETFYKSIKY